MRRQGLVNNLSLALAPQEKIDILLIQEQWMRLQLEKSFLKKHHSYQAYVPKKE